MKRISRRTVLRGVAGTTLALPLLEIMEDDARAGGLPPTPQRFLVTFCGSSLGHDSDQFTPDGTGSGYDLKTSLRSLGAGAPTDGLYDIQDHVSVVSGLSIPSLHYSETPTEPATAIDTFHTGYQGPLFSGTSSHTNSFYVNPDGEEVGSTLPPQGPSSQYVVAEAIGGGTVFGTLDYSVAAGSSTQLRRCMAYRRDGSDALPVAAIESPRQAYNSLIGQATFGSDAEAAARQDYLFRRQLSALDLAAEDARRLSQRTGLGVVDQRRLDRHFTELRELEQRIQALREFVPGESCQPMDDPGPDPAFDGVWRNENARSRTLAELLRLAFICDLTRAGSLMYTAGQNSTNLSPVTGYNDGCHGLTHSGGHGAPGDYAQQVNTQMGAVVGWHVQQFAMLARMLADTPDGPDTTVLDNTVMLFLPEGGSVPNAHSRDNYAMLVAGHAGGLVGGRHIRQSGIHPTRVVTTAMSAVGAGSTLGEISGTIPELFGA